MKTTYVIHCEKCNLSVDQKIRDENPSSKCPSFKNKKLEWRPTNLSPSFTQRLYPFYHQGIGEVVTSEKQMTQRCSQLGFKSNHEGAQMTHKQERHLLSKRVSENPREIRQKATWSGKGANLQTFDFQDK